MRMRCGTPTGTLRIHSTTFITAKTFKDKKIRKESRSIMPDELHYDHRCFNSHEQSVCDCDNKIFFYLKQIKIK
jgi:hypothetical protein